LGEPWTYFIHKESASRFSQLRAVVHYNNEFAGEGYLGRFRDRDDIPAYIGVSFMVRESIAEGSEWLNMGITVDVITIEKNKDSGLFREAVERFRNRILHHSKVRKILELSKEVVELEGRNKQKEVQDKLNEILDVAKG